MNKSPDTDLQIKQLEKLQELGSYLHQRRTEKGISLEAIAQHTKVQTRLLRAIEAGNWEELPEPVYIQGMLKQFANALGLNGAEFASAFPLETSLPRQGYIGLRLPWLQLRPLHLYLLYIVVVVISVRGISNLLRQSAVEESSNEPQLVIVDNSTKSAEPAPEMVEPTVSVSEKQPVKPVVIEVQLKDDCWLRVTADGQTEFEGVLPKGTVRTWVANEEITIRTGNAGGVVVTFNDQKAQQLGAPGQVQEVTYQASS